jgi:aspartyl-tRNA(Asn)/glutamyl-tRNA(Gln) amidotransferase subunit A
MIDLNNITVKKIHGLLDDKKISCRELVAIYQENIKDKNSKTNAYLEIFDDAFGIAEEEDKRIRSGSEPKPLSGVPFAIKDNILIKGKAASAASKILEGYKAVYSSTVIKKLRDAGAIFLGRTNMDEFAMGSSTENSAFGETRNPYDASRVAGGSSGGSAAAVSANLCLAALGSDTGGSIRQPAAFCGVVGLKPTYGAVSRHGLIAMASSLDQIGPITKTVEDSELIFNIIKGKDPADSTTFEASMDDKSRPINSLVVGIPKEYAGEGIDSDILEKVQSVAEKLKLEGAELKEISLPHTEYALACYYIIMPAEVSSNLARFDGVKYGLKKEGRDLLEDYALTRARGFGKEVRRRIILGTFVLSAGYYESYYGRAQKIRRLVKKDFEEAFKKVDIILTPTTPTPAFEIGEKAEDPVKMYLSDVFTVPVNLAGLPSISVPAGFVERKGKKLPVGAQLIAPWFCENRLFNAGKKIELAVNN